MRKRASYRCSAGHEWLVEHDASDTLVDLKCQCGADGKYVSIAYEPKTGWSDPVPCDAPYAFVKGRAYEFKKQYEVMPQGYHYGVPDHVHNEKYRRRFEGMARESRRFRGGHSKLKTETPQYLGGMSAEMVHSIGLQERDPEAVSKDPIEFLKKTGNYVGE